LLFICLSIGIWQTNCLRCIRIACPKYKQIETFNNCKPSLGGVCSNSMPPLREIFTNSMPSLRVVCPKCMSCTIYYCELWPCSDEIKNDKNAAGKESRLKNTLRDTFKNRLKIPGMTQWVVVSRWISENKFFI